MVMQTLDTSNISHKPDALLSDDEVDFLDERNKENNLSHLKNGANTTPCKQIPPTAVLISPSSSNDSVSSNSSTGDFSEEESADIKKLLKTEHKLAEVEGRHLPEPLLVTNPHRFVLFPIQDNDVSLLKGLFYH